MSNPSTCPTCGRTLDPADLVNDPASLIRHTGEFTVPQFSNQEMVGAAEPVQPRPRVEGRVSCNWCGKPAGEVRKLLSGPGVHICDGCVALCYMVLRDELPDFS